MSVRGAIAGARRPALTMLRPWPEGWRAAAALALVVAGGIHLAVALPHAEGSPLLGAGMAVVGVAQLAAACVLLARVSPRNALAVGAVVSLGALVVYVMSRTGDLPFMPPHGHEAGHVSAQAAGPGGIGDPHPVLPGSRTESVGVVDVACAVAELVVVGVGLTRLPRGPSDLLAVGCGLAVLTLVGWRLVA